MNDLIEQVETVTEYLKCRLSKIGRGTVVAVHGGDLRRALGAGSLATARGLRAAEFWLCEDGLWRSVAGCQPVNLFEE